MWRIVAISCVWAQTLTLSDIWREYRYYAQSYDWIATAEGWYGQAESGAIYRVGASLRAETLGRAEPAERWLPAPEGKGWLLWRQLQPGFRHSRQGALVWVRDGQSRSLPGQSWAEAAFLPTGDALIAADLNNLYLFRWGASEPEALTRYQGAIRAGTTDWLYEEEFGFTQAFAVSPSGSYVAYLVFDNSATPVYTFHRYPREGYPTPQQVAYPRAGERNPKVSLWLYDLSGRRAVQLFADSTGGYIPWLSWSTMGDELYFTHLNRPQNSFVVYRHEPGGPVQPFFRDSVAGGFFTWDNRQLIVWSPDQPELYYLAGGKGVWEVHRYDYKGRRLAVYSVPGLRSLIGCAGGRLFFHAAGKDPIHQRIGYLRLGEKQPKPVWLTADTLWAEGELAGEVLKVRESRFTEPYRERLLSARSPERSLPLTDLNAPLRTQLPSVQVRFVQYAGAEKDPLWAYLLLPADFVPTQRYPVVLTFYGGPGSQSVSTGFKNVSFFWQAYLVQRGYIVACADVRGTAVLPERRFATYRRLGIAETEDLVAFIRWLQEQPYAGRMGAFGWSYGGYLAARLAFAAPDGLAAAVAVAPVTDWRLYDSAYTERFMDTPESNAPGYSLTALPPAEKPLRVPLLLIHGDADDNVHVQHTYQLIERLLRSQPEAPVEWQIYPNQNHGIGAYRYRVYWEVERFFEQHLRQGPQPSSK